MPKSPSQITVGAFIKNKPPDPLATNKKKPRSKAQKRKLSVSPTAAPVPKKDALPSPPSPGSIALPKSPPLLPYQARPKKSKRFSLSPPPSRMDSALLAACDGDLPMETPTSDEVEELLREDSSAAQAPSLAKETLPSPSASVAPDSPTAAVKSAIEAKIAENLDNLLDDPIFVIDANKNDSTQLPTAPTPAPTPCLVKPKPTPVPLVPNGLPIFSNRYGRGQSSGAGVPPGSGVSTEPNKNKSTYAAKAKTPPKRVDNILFIYSTSTSKQPLAYGDWEQIDLHLLNKLASPGSGDPVARIANSGYDVTHKCGFIACRDLITENWCKSVILRLGGGLGRGVGAYRAWSRGEQPEARLCRFYFPTRFDGLNDDQIISLLVRHNPPFKNATLTLKRSEMVRGGRAIFIELDPDAYSYAKSRGYKVEFALMDIDCQLFVPPTKRAATNSSIQGITKLSKLSQPASSSSTLAAPSSESAADVTSPAVASSLPTAQTASLPASQPVGPSRLDPRITKNTAPQPSFAGIFQEQRKKLELEASKTDMDTSAPI